MIAFYSTTLALFLSMTLVPLLASRATSLGLQDLPNARKIHQSPVPRVGGLAIAAGALLSVVVWLPVSGAFAGYLTGASLIAIFGLVDDILDLDYRFKFLGQLAGVLLFMWLADVHLTRIPFSYSAVMPGWLGVPLTVLVMVGITNAVNLSDGMDGLAGGTTLIAACALGYFSHLGGDDATAVLALCIVGAVLGFLRFNSFPARVFMGDSGSQFLGFSVAALGVLVIEQANTAISPLVPVLVLGAPIADTLYVMIRRVLMGRPPFVADLGHIHHRLLALGLSQREAVLVIYAFQVVLIVLAWRLMYAPDSFLLAVYVLLAGGVYLGLYLWSNRKTSLRRTLRRVFLGLTPRRATRWAGRAGRASVVYGVSLLLPVLALSLADVSRDAGWLALLLAGAMILAAPLRLLPQLWTERLAAFAAAVTLAYLAHANGLEGPATIRALYVCVVLIVLGMALWLRFGTGGAFTVNGVDVLMVLIVVTIPNMPVVKDAGLGPVFLVVLVLFYACELILHDGERKWHCFRGSVLVALAVLGARGVF